MQFNSYIYILFFLPLIVLGYYIMNKVGKLWGIWYLGVMSLIFYLYAGISGGILFGFSILINYFLTRCIDIGGKWKKYIFVIGIIFNISILVRYKYLEFIVQTINEIFERDYDISETLLPLGVSFIVFQQLAYLIDCYKNELDDRSFTSYLLYIAFFPKLIMGPIVSPNILISQFYDNSRKKVNFDNVVIGIRIFNIGLYKKVIIADTFAVAVNTFYANIYDATALDAFIIMLAYTLQIYFDFSGYSDMAIGTAKMINIDLPFNFNSPYKSISITEFWKRWHITLNQFFIKYVYIPLGGNRKGALRTYSNIMVVFLLSGIWHGANWTFILWGLLHGIFSVLERKYSSLINKFPHVLRWLGTFLIVNLLWLLFRSESVLQWTNIVEKMCSFEGLEISPSIVSCFMLPEIQFILESLRLMQISSINILVAILWFIIALCICFFGKNAMERKYVNNIGTAFLSMIMFIWSLICLSGESTFLYFNF